MTYNKSYKQICDEFFKFKVTFTELMYMMKIFIFTYKNITENMEYPDDDENVAQNCLYTICENIDRILTKTVKQIEYIYNDFEKINNYDNKSNN